MIRTDISHVESTCRVLNFFTVKIQVCCSLARWSNHVARKKKLNIHAIIMCTLAKGAGPKKLEEIGYMYIKVIKLTPGRSCSMLNNTCVLCYSFRPVLWQASQMSQTFWATCAEWGLGWDQSTDNVINTFILWTEHILCITLSGPQWIWTDLVQYLNAQDKHIP